MTRSLVATVLAVAVVAAGCARPPRTCEEVAEGIVAVAQDLIDEAEARYGDVPPGEISDGDLPGLDDLAARTTRLTERADELGCDPAELRRLVAEGSSRLRASTPVGRLVVEAIRQG